MGAIVWSRVGAGAIQTTWGCALFAACMYARRNDTYTRPLGQSGFVRLWVLPRYRPEFEDPEIVAANLRDALRVWMGFGAILALLGMWMIAQGLSSQ